MDVAHVGRGRLITILIMMLVAANFAGFGGNQSSGSVSLKDECLRTMLALTDTLLQYQISSNMDINQGAIKCPSCKVLHTRAAEAVYPFAVAYQQSRDAKYFDAARRLGNWLIRQQLPDGAWKETPEEWTGTTTDQLLMMVLAFQKLQQELSKDEAIAWVRSMKQAADYLTRMMDPGFASINYCATTAATLSVMNRHFPDQAYIAKARLLARQVLSKMDEDGFIQAEGERVYSAKYGSDIGYEIDMSLWGLELYARETGDAAVHQAIAASLENHLFFVYPNGAIDGSWGIRSNKWATYGSATADGCQILFSLFAGEDARYRTAAKRNLDYLRTMIQGGMIGYGPHYFSIFSQPPCIYPTFVRSKNLALASQLGEQEPGSLPPIPTDKVGWARLFTAVDVALVRTGEIMATISGYGYKDLQKTYKSKYMHRPTGGAISCLWVKDHGFLQISSQTEYNRWEPMHFPEVENVACLTPRIEFRDPDGYFTNLYEYDAHLRLIEGSSGFRVSASGELNDKKLLPGGVAYTLDHDFSDRELRKTVSLRYHGKKPVIDIIEPIVWMEGMKLVRLDDRRVRIKGPGREFLFELTKGRAGLEVGSPGELIFNVFPSIKCLPLRLHLPAPETETRGSVVYRIAVSK